MTRGFSRAALVAYNAWWAHADDLDRTSAYAGFVAGYKAALTAQPQPGEREEAKRVAFDKKAGEVLYRLCKDEARAQTIPLTHDEWWAIAWAAPRLALRTPVPAAPDPRGEAKPMRSVNEVERRYLPNAVAERERPEFGDGALAGGMAVPAPEPAPETGADEPHNAKGGEQPAASQYARRDPEGAPATTPAPVTGRAQDERGEDAPLADLMWELEESTHPLALPALTTIRRLLRERADAQDRANVLATRLRSPAPQGEGREAAVYRQALGIAMNGLREIAEEVLLDQTRSVARTTQDNVRRHLDLLPPAPTQREDEGQRSRTCRCGHDEAHWHPECDGGCWAPDCDCACFVPAPEAQPESEGT